MKLWILSTVIIFQITSLFSQENSLHKIITELGIENVYIETKGDSTILVYENRMYGSELKTMGLLLNKMEGHKEIGRKLKFIPMNRGIPISSVNFEMENDTWEMTHTSLDTDYLSNSPENTSMSFLPVSENWRKNSSFGKWKISFIPDVRAKFHTKEGFIRLKLNAIAQASISIWKGLKINSQVMIPLFYQFDDKIAEVKPGSNYMNYTIRFDDNLWVSTSAGMFHWKSGNYKDSLTDIHLGMHEWYRYGISMESVKFFAQGKYSLIFRTDLTGHLSYQNTKWFYSSLNDRFTWFAGAGYRTNYPDVFLQVGWGQDLYKNTPFEFKIIRTFRELDLGAFLLWNDKDALESFTAGASISFPLPYFNYQNKKMLVSSSKRFDWFVWYHSGFGGRYPRSQNKIHTFQKRLTPIYIKNNTQLIEGVH